MIGRFLDIRASSQLGVLLVILPLILSTWSTTIADTHYVSHTGSNSSPYTSWATATDSILLAVLSADSGDTIQIGAGTFTSDSITLKSDQVFRGLGSDSSHILHNGSDTQLLIFADGCVIERLHLSGIVDTNFGAFSYHLGAVIHARGDRAGIIRNNNITDADHGILVANTAGLDSTKRVIIESNRFSDLGGAISVLSGHAIIHKNSFFMTNRSISGPICQVDGPITVTNNLLVQVDDVAGGPMIDLNACSEIVIENNVCVSLTSNSLPAVFNNQNVAGWPTSGRIENNLFRGRSFGVRSFGGNIAIKNNIIMETRIVALQYDTAQTDSGNVGYNLYWDIAREDSTFDMAFLPDPGNLFADPMFEDTVSYRLEAFSPAIDAGDPSILDVDGSRSDIGPCGGPGGKAAYVYQDLPPDMPDGISGNRTSSEITLNWYDNSESDLSHYEVLRSTSGISGYDLSLVIAGFLTDTNYIDNATSDDTGYYYRITAVDGQNNRSSLSSELFFIATDISEPDPTLPHEYILFPNYPNPFNSGTHIRFVLGSSSAPSVTVSLSIHDITGRLVRVLANRHLGVGEHILRWNGRDDRGLKLPTGVYFIRLIGDNFIQVRKALLLK